MITSLGYGTYMFFGSLMILMGFWAFFFIPETKGKTLEQMEELFMPKKLKRAILDLESPLTEKEGGMVHFEGNKDEKKGWRDRKVTQVLSA
jgi:Sugar (and other) transporter